MTSSTGAVIGLGYDNRNRLTTVTSSGSTIGSYQYNGFGDRVWRTITSPSTGQAATVYDPTGTGNLYGEYFATDYREYVYLAGIPVAVSTDAGKAAPAISTLYADHLGTVRAVLNSAGTSTYTWPWLNNAFGEQPMGGSSAFYTRFPGQYWDEESGLFYNHNRYFDSDRGGYLQSDPRGLKAGISTYAYVSNSPLDNFDPLGLQSVALCANPANAAACAAAGMASSGESGLSATAVGGAAAAAAAGSLSSDSKPCPNDDCAALVAQINAQTSLMEDKYDEMLDDEHNLYTRAFNTKLSGDGANWGTWVGHVDRYTGLQTGLQRMIARAEAKGCPVPAKAYQMANTPAPHAPVNSYD